MHTTEFTAPSGPDDKNLKGSLEELAGISNINAFQNELYVLSQTQLKTVRENLTARLGLIEGEIIDDSGKLWHQVLIDISNELRSKILVVTNLMEGGTINPHIH